MIVSKAPLRISFVGGGTDLPAFYKHYPGRVLSATINKFVYIVINPGLLLNRFIVKYIETENVGHPRELKHERFREALLKFNVVDRGVEIASFADLPAKTGLGSSSAFSVALIKSLNTYLGKSISKEEAAEAACELEIDILKEPIGKQDQYAAAFGGFNVFEFRENGVSVVPVFLDFKVRAKLESHILLYFTGMTRDASSVLGDQSNRVAEKFEIYKQMSDSVPVFCDKLVAGDLKGMADMLREGWERKKSLSPKISNSMIDQLYEAGKDAGAWGGKVLGAGGGGCLMFICPPEKQSAINDAVENVAKKLGLQDFNRIPFQFTQSGTDILFNSSH